MHTLLTLYFVPLAYMSVSMPVPYCFDNFSFVIYFEIRRCEGFSFVLFAQDCMALGSLRFRVNFSIRNICKICIMILIWIILNLLITLGIMGILTILIFPIYEHGLSFHLSVSSLINFINVQCTRTFTFWLSLFLSILFFLFQL